MSSSTGRVAAAFAWVTVLAGAAGVEARYLDQGQELRLGVRTYVNARVGTENTDVFEIRPEDLPNLGPDAVVTNSETFPYSSAGHLRQNRFFLEVDLEHKLDRLLQDGFGPLWLLNRLPLDIEGLAYRVTFRSEYEGVYDWGPSEYRTASSYTTGSLLTNPDVELPNNPISGLEVDVAAARRNLRDKGSHRERLFQAYVEGNVGDTFFRFGRQNLSWGESDGFRLLDQINPLDNSFGGFLISLDERRVPLDMLRMQHYLGGIGPIYDAFIEAYAAIDDEVSYVPGLLQGSPWGLPQLDKPSAVVKPLFYQPNRNFEDIRGGARLVFSQGRGTFSIAHYYTFADQPNVLVQVAERFPLRALPSKYLSETSLTPAQIQISGGSATWAVPYEWAQKIGLSGEPIVRMEFAYMKDEPRSLQEGIDPFLFYLLESRRPDGMPKTESGNRTGDSINALVGVDINQWIRFLNPSQSFLFSTQFFYKRLQGAGERAPVDGYPTVETGEVLLVPERLINPRIAGLNLGFPLEPVFVRQPTDQFLQTLIITTSYRSGMITPVFAMFYDWSGSVAIQPSLTLSYDPFRFVVDYSFIEANKLKGSSGISLLRDRDNVQFRIEYVL
jgi:hypothetical protein